MTYVLILGKLLVGFLVLIVLLHVIEKKELATVSPLDMVYAAALGDLIVDAAYDEKVGVMEVLFGILAWSAFVWIMDKLSAKYGWLEKISKGRPEIVVMKGEIISETLKKNRISREELESLLRQKGVFSIDQVEIGVLEINGELSVKRMES